MTTPGATPPLSPPPTTTTRSTTKTTSTPEFTSTTTVIVAPPTTTKSTTTLSTTRSTTSPTLLPTTTPPPVSTRTSTRIIPATVTPTNTAAASNSGFFQNKGAVAGVFTIVGLIGLALLIALCTAYIRRRRAKKFDDEAAEAAAEAAATAHAPIFLDDDPFISSPYNNGDSTSYGGGSSYHGYAGAPMQPQTQYNYAPGEYGMSEFSGGSSGGWDGGNAGVGAAMTRNRSMGRGGVDRYAPGPPGEGNAPYPAFLQGPTQDRLYDPTAPNSGMRYRRPNQENDALDVGLGAAAGAAAAAALQRNPTTSTRTDLSRNKSLGDQSYHTEHSSAQSHHPNSSSGGGAAAVVGESYASHYAPNSNPIHETSSQEAHFPPEGAFPNPYANQHSPGIVPDPGEDSESDYDDDPYGGGASRRESTSGEGETGRRVLKVANA